MTPLERVDQLDVRVDRSSLLRGGNPLADPDAPGEVDLRRRQRRRSPCDRASGDRQLELPLDVPPPL
jgi:hypothetical protein